MIDALLDWIKQRGRKQYVQRDVEPERPKPQGRGMSGKYRLLYKYLEERYANTVVLTFAEVEDLLGFALPDQARLHEEWWTSREPNVDGTDHADSWLLASRTALPNLPAQTVAFERAA